jgi:putative FmdB family regulatory protein
MGRCGLRADAQLPAHRSSTRRSPVPTYQYVCTDCNSPHEAQQSFSEDALTECPTCDGRLRKVFSAVGVVFKGSGFYRNDSRAPEPSNGAADNSADGSSSKKSDPSDKSEASSSKDAKSETASGSSKPDSSGTGSGSGSNSGRDSGKATAAAGATGGSAKQ